MDYLAMILLAFVGTILMLIILLQRGRGGGLAGAFGGLGGQSAFGTKAGDVFTKITVVLATIWVVLAGLSGFALRAGSEQQYPGGANVMPEQPEIGSETGDEAEEQPAEATEEPSETPAAEDSTDAAPAESAPAGDETSDVETPASPSTETSPDSPASETEPETP